MSTTYHKISRTEFENFLADYNATEVDVAGTKERVYDIDTPADGVVVRVFSTLTEQDAGSRDSGTDAIRTLAYAPEAGEILDGATRTHRIDSWAANLAPKIDELLARAAAGEFVDPMAETRALEFDTERGQNGDLYVADLFKNNYDDLRAKLDGDTYPARETIKSVGWNETHHEFDPSDKTWVVDATSLPAVAATLRAEGYALFEDDPDAEDRLDVNDLPVTPVEGDRVVVTYAKKNGNGEAEKSGTITRYDHDDDEAGITFKRDDGQVMFLTNEGLYTAGSSFPYVGEPLDVTVEVAA